MTRTRHRFGLDALLAVCFLGLVGLVFAPLAHCQTGTLLSTSSIPIKSGASTVTSIVDPAQQYSTNHTVEAVFSGTAPATASIVITGIMRGGTSCPVTGTLSTTATTSAVLQANGVCDKLQITTSWTGGDTTTKLTLNTLGTPYARAPPTGPVLPTQGLPGLTIDARLNSCLTRLASSGGVCDMRADSGGAAAASVAETQSNITVLLPSANITFGAGLSWTISGNNDWIIGQGRSLSVLDFSANGGAADLVSNGNGTYLGHFEIKSSGMLTAGTSGNGVAFGVGAPVSDETVDDVYVLYAGNSAVSFNQCTRCTFENSYTKQSYGFSASIGSNSTFITRNIRIVNNVFEECNFGPLSGNGCINTNGPVTDLLIQGNEIRNDVNGFPTCNSGSDEVGGNLVVSGTSSGATGTLTIVSGPAVFPSGFIVGGLVTVQGMLPAGYNNSSTIISGGAGTTSLTYTTNGSNIGASSQNSSAVLVQSTASTGCYEGIQTSRATTNFTITGNVLNHINAEGIGGISNGPGVIAANTCNHCGENGPGVGGVSIGSTTTSYSIIGAVDVIGNTITDSPYCFALQFAGGVFNQTLAKVHFLGNVCKKVDGYPAIAVGMNFTNNGPNATAIGAGGVVCAAGVCTVTMSANSVTCAAGDVWSIRGVTGTTGATGATAFVGASYNGDWVINTPTNSTGCTGFKFNLTGAANTSIGAGIAYPAQFVNDIIVADNDLSDAALPVSFWPQNNPPSGFVDVHGNKTVAGTITTLYNSVVPTGFSESGNLVTVTGTFTNPPFIVNGQVFVAGVVPAGYNGQFSLVSSSAGSLTYIDPIAGLGAGTTFGTVAMQYIPGNAGDTFHNVYGPAPTYNGAGGSAHRFTTGHVFNFPAASGAITTSCSSAFSACPILSVPMSNAHQGGFVIRWEIEAFSATTTVCNAGTTACYCSTMGETQIALADPNTTSGTLASQVTTVGGATACTTTGTLSATWTTAISGGVAYLLVSPNANFVPTSYTMRYSVESFGKDDPTYDANPAALF